MYVEKVLVYNMGVFLFKFVQLTYADITIFDLSNNYLWRDKPGFPEHLDKFPKLAEHYKRVREVPKIKAWLEKRPESDY